MNTTGKMASRSSIRLSEFNYGSSGWYFVTICTYLKLPLLGKLENNSIVLSDIGKLAAECWENLGNIYAGITPQAYIIMPNHIHGIISIQEQNNPDSINKLRLPDIVRNFKAFTTHEYYMAGQGRKLWQRGYFEHVIRDSSDLARIEEYIENNPAVWAQDKYYLDG